MDEKEHLVTEIKSILDNEFDGNSLEDKLHDIAEWFLETLATAKLEAQREILQEVSFIISPIDALIKIKPLKDKLEQQLETLRKEQGK